MIRAAVMLGVGCVLLSAQEPVRIFTSAQAETGRLLYARTCSQCHIASLLGRKADGGELPPISSLTKTYQDFIGPRRWVPPLTGDSFLERYGQWTAAELIERFQETVDDRTLNFADMGGDATVNLTAYILQVNGAKAGSEKLTRSTGALVRAATR